ncbi:MAG: LON peptidase substrate-binding domain-containing protein [Xanthomonadales bacterium]|nr:LON peptidase substrate-binding domain-containing protein [Xanthomonadales bacterium]
MASASPVITDLPLFPLSSVLFPGAQLPLRIFEPRYLGMVRDCARDDAPFGVCLILEGDEVGEPAIPAAVGTLAKITDFDALPDGLLGIHASGGERFRVIATHVRDDGLIHAQVRCWAPEPQLPVPPEFGLLPTILARLIDQFPVYDGVSQTCYDDASWVGFRLAQWLPLALDERQHMLEMTDPMQRLACLLDVMPRFQRD